MPDYRHADRRIGRHRHRGSQSLVCAGAGRADCMSPQPSIGRRCGQTTARAVLRLCNADNIGLRNSPLRQRPVQGQDNAHDRCPNPVGGSNDAIGITAHGIVGAFVFTDGTTVLSARDFLLDAVFVSVVLGSIHHGRRTSPDMCWTGSADNVRMSLAALAPEFSILSFSPCSTSRC